MKYHLKNKLSKKALRESRNKPLPLGLMKYDKDNRMRINDERNRNATKDNDDIQRTEDNNTR